MSNFNPQFEKIGNILVYNKIISENDLNKALAEQKNSNEKLGYLLVKLGYITEKDLVDAYSQQMGHRAIDLETMVKANLEKIEFVTYGWILFGEYDLLARVQADDEFLLTRCIVEDIRPMKGIADTKTLIGAEL